MFCSDLARRAREPLAGTASHALGCVLLGYPKRLWGRDALASEGFSPELSSELLRLVDERDVVTRLMAHEGTWTGRTEVVFFPEGLRFRDVAMDEVLALISAARRGSLPEGGERQRDPIILCCTHGQRDRCCALFGLAIVVALRAALRPGAPIEIREASHLGGDRFAATAMVLPSGHTYGHLEPADAPALLTAASGGAPLVSRFRGSLWLEPAAQLAEAAAFALTEFRDLLPTLDPIEVSPIDRERCELRTKAQSGDHRVAIVVRCALEQRRVVGDCHNADRHRTGQVGVWRVEEVLTSIPPPRV